MSDEVTKGPQKYGSTEPKGRTWSMRLEIYTLVEKPITTFYFDYLEGRNIYIYIYIYINNTVNKLLKQHMQMCVTVEIGATPTKKIKHLQCLTQHELDPPRNKSQNMFGTNCCITKNTKT